MNLTKYIGLLFMLLILQSNSCNQNFKKDRLSKDEIWWNVLNEYWKELMLRESHHLDDNINEQILEEILNLKQLSADHYPINDLKAVEKLTQLESLSAGNTQITDLIPIEKLTKLKSITFPATPIVDLSPLKSLTELEEVYIQQTLVKDLNPLSNAKNLQVLVIFDTKITSLSPLLNLKKLSILNINGLNIPQEEIEIIKNNNPECEIIK